MREWFGEVKIGPALRNGSLEQWATFIKDIPAGSPQRPSITYLASHQTPAAEWEFIDKQQVRWSKLLVAGNRKSASPSLVILDACFAASVQSEPEWSRFAPCTLFASDRLEAEYEIRFDRSRPFDAPRRFPAAREWLRTKLGKSWDGRISFLGLMWLEAFRETPVAPQSPADWKRFLERVKAKASAFRQKESRRLASSIRVSGDP